MPQIPTQNPNERLMQYLQSLQYGAFEKPAAPMDLSAYDSASATQQQSAAQPQAPATQPKELTLLEKLVRADSLDSLGLLGNMINRALNSTPASGALHDVSDLFFNALAKARQQVGQPQPKPAPTAQPAQQGQSPYLDEAVKQLQGLSLNNFSNNDTNQAAFDWLYQRPQQQTEPTPAAAPNVDMSTVNAANTVGNTLVPRKENLSPDAAAQQAKAAFVPVGSVAKPYEMPSGFMAKVGKFFAPLGYEQQRLMNQAANDAHEQFKLNPTPESQATWDAARAQLGNIGHEVNANNQARIAAYQQLMAQQNVQDRLAQAELLAADRLATQMEIERVRQANMNKRAEDKAKNDMSWIEKAFPVKSATEAKAVEKVSEKNRIKIKKID